MSVQVDSEQADGVDADGVDAGSMDAEVSSPGTSSPGTPAPRPARTRAAATWPLETRARFLEALAELGQVRAAARAVGVSPQSAYRLRRKSPAFARAWQDAMDQALDALEETLLDRAMNGVEKPVYYGGKSCGSVRQYSDALAMFLLRARRPETYGRSAGVETVSSSGSSSGPYSGPPAAPASAPALAPSTAPSVPVPDPVMLIEARLKALARGELPPETAGG